MSYIKKEPLLRIAKELLSDDAFGSVRIVREIENAPAEDVVEVDRLDLILKLQHDKSLETLREYIQENDVVKVTRCKDCENSDYYCSEKKKGCEPEGHYVCCVLGKRVPEDFYCKSGERRTDNE